VRNFLVSNALYWVKEFHADGLRVDGVASMLYLDYSRKDGEWVPNQQGGRDNLEAVAFLREMNEVVYGEHPGTILVAKQVLQPAELRAPRPTPPGSADKGGQTACRASPLLVAGSHPGRQLLPPERRQAEAGQPSDR